MDKHLPGFGDSSKYSSVTPQVREWSRHFLYPQGSTNLQEDAVINFQLQVPPDALIRVSIALYIASMYVY